MIQDLELAKNETWEEKERLSSKYEEERTKNLASKVRIWNKYYLTIIINSWYYLRIVLGNISNLIISYVISNVKLCSTIISPVV